MIKKKLYLLPLLLLALSFVACSESEEIGKYYNWQTRNEAFIDSLTRVYEKETEPRTLHRREDERNKGIYIYYKIIEKGDTHTEIIDGETVTLPLSPVYTDKVSVFYRGMYINEGIFSKAEAPEYFVTRLYAENGIDIFEKNFSKDDPSDFDSPTTLGVNQVVTGWTEMLQIMRPGDRYEVYVPYQSGYGASTTSSGVMAYSTLIFDMKLVSVIVEEP